MPTGHYPFYLRIESIDAVYTSSTEYDFEYVVRVDNADITTPYCEYTTLVVNPSIIASTTIYNSASNNNFDLKSDGSFLNYTARDDSHVKVQNSCM